MTSTAANMMSGGTGYWRPVWADVDLDALRHNVGVLRAKAGVPVWAVVKADGYGHGAGSVAKAALEAGAGGLAVALVEEGVLLRELGLTAPILLLSEPPQEAVGEVVRHSLIPTVYTPKTIDALSRAVGGGHRIDVHVKVDTGMHRVGADIGAVGALVEQVAGSRGLRFGGLWTHLAKADGCTDADVSFTRLQLERLSVVVAELAKQGFEVPVVHSANSAATFAFGESRLDMVRCGLACYGIDPLPPTSAVSKGGGVLGGDGDGDGDGSDSAGGLGESANSDADLPAGPTRDSRLRPVLSWRAKVSFVRELEGGEGVSYGRLRPLPERSVVATVPVGYADGLPRRYFSEGGTVLIGGRHCPLAGAVTMDQVMVDCGPDARVSPGDEVVLIGVQGAGNLSAMDWARVLGTIPYEVLCGIGVRVPRIVKGQGT